MHGTHDLTKLNTKSSSRKLQLQLSIEFQMPWSWRIKFQGTIFHMIFTTISSQTKMRTLLTSNKFLEFMPSKSATKECLSSPSSREDNGQIATLLRKNACLWFKMTQRVWIAPNIWLETLQWKEEVTVPHPKWKRRELLINKDSQLNTTTTICKNLWEFKRPKMLTTASHQANLLDLMSIAVQLCKVQKPSLDSQYSLQAPNHLSADS